MRSKKEVSAIVSGWGLGMSVLTKLMEKGRRRGLSDEDFYRLAKPEGDATLQKFVDIMVENARPTYKVEVNRDLTRAQSIEAGKYDWINSDITQEHFPVKGSGKQTVNIVLFHFNRTITSDEVIAEMKKAGYRPGPVDIDELLGLGAAYPDLQKEFSIAGLGSVWRCPEDGGRHVPCLGWRGAGRDLHLCWFGFDWIAGLRFAAVARK